MNTYRPPDTVIDEITEPYRGIDLFRAGYGTNQYGNWIQFLVDLHDTDSPTFEDPAVRRVDLLPTDYWQEGHSPGLRSVVFRNPVRAANEKWHASFIYPSINKGIALYSDLNDEAFYPKLVVPDGRRFRHVSTESDVVADVKGRYVNFIREALIEYRTPSELRASIEV